MTPKELYVQSRKAGYSKEKATERVRSFQQTGAVPEDPTEAYWGALIKQESGGKQSAVSPKGAVGRAQVMPKTAPEAAALAGLEFNEDRWRNDPVYNEAIGRAYFRKQHEDFGDPRLAAAAYNAGPGAVRKSGGDISKLPQETRDYVPAVTGNKPMTPKEKFIQLRQQGYSKEDAAAIARGQAGPQQQAPAPAPQQPMPQQQAAPQQLMSQQPMPPQQPAAQPTPSGAYLNEEMQRQLQSGTGEGRFSAGVQRSAANLLTGGRQLFNQLTGDEEDLAALAEEKNQRDAMFQKYDPEGSGFSAGDAGKLFGDVASFGAVGGSKLAGQMVAGGVEGALQPAQGVGERLGNVATGAAMGTVGPLVSGLRGMAKNMTPVEAAKDFTTRVMGQAPGAPVMGAYDKTVEKVGDAATAVRDKYKAALQGAEQVPNLPLVSLNNTAKEIGGPLGLEDEVVRALSERARKTIETTQSGALRISPIVDRGGQPFTAVEKRTFEDVRATLREIKARQNEFSKAGKVGAAGQLEDLRQTLESDLDRWGYSGSAQSKASLEGARAADVMYRDEVLPAQKLADSLKAPDGKSIENKLDQYLFGGTYTPGQSGTEVRKLLEVAPEVKDPLRKILASKLNVPRGEQASARSFVGGTTAEALFSKKEREYMTSLADELQKNPSLFRLKLPLVDKSLKALGVGSVKPYDYVPLSKGPVSQKIINALRSGAIGSEDE